MKELGRARAGVVLAGALLLPWRALAAGTEAPAGESPPPATITLHPLSRHDRLRIEERDLQKSAAMIELQKKKLARLEAQLRQHRAGASAGAIPRRAASLDGRRRVRPSTPAPIPWTIPELPQWVKAWGLAVAARNLDMPYDQVWPAGASSYCAERPCPLARGNWRPGPPSGFQRGIGPSPRRYYWPAPLPVSRR